MCNRLITSYGSAETGTVAAAWAETLDLDSGDVGFIVPGAQIDLVDAETREPATDEIGSLKIRNTGLASGYFGDAEANKAFEGGAFYSNDLGSIAPDGKLTIHGRSSNVVNLGGDKATIERIELHYARAPGIRDLAAVPMRDGLGLTKLVAVVVPNEQWSEAEFWTFLRGSIPRTFWPVKLAVIPDLPRGSNGKIDRAKLKSLVSS
jgi:acyl-coenzyme A synthetase/AMP-(fatty) acid ligase